MANFITHPYIRDGEIESRVYQEVLVASALTNGNTMIVAPTGLGKTNIAAMVIAKTLKDNPESKILMLAPTKPLVLQHEKSLKRVLNVTEDKFATFTGAVTPGLRQGLWNQKQVIIATPQSIENDVYNDNISLKDVALIVFDEAHRAVQGYSYVYIAESYLKKNKRPFILALTASPGASKEKIQEICANLYIQNVEIKTEQDQDVIGYVQDKTVVWKEIDFPEDFKNIQRLFDEHITQLFTQLKDMNLTLNYQTRGINKADLLKLQQYLLKIRNKNPNAYKALSVSAALMKMNHAKELFETQGLQPLRKYFRRLENDTTKASKAILEDLKIQKARVLVDRLYNNNQDHPKIKALVETAKQELETADKIIVFAHYRGMTKHLENLLKKEGIESHQFIGQATRGNDKGFTQKKQAEILDKFRAGEFSILITTSVGEEGLDLPEVDTVMFYEPVPSEIRSIQRSGRTARHRAGKVIIFITKGTKDEAYYWSSVNKEKKMKSILKGMDAKTATAQQKITEYMEDKPEKEIAVIYTDIRERASGILKELSEIPDIRVKAKQLPVADFLVSDRVAIERKEGNDFITSIINGRIFNQAQELVSNFQRPIIIVEGEIFGIRNVHDNAIRGALTSLMVDFGIPVFQTNSVKETAEMIAFIAKREQLQQQREVRLQGEKRAFGQNEQLQFIVESLPLVGPQMAKSLLKKFGTVQNVFNAQEQELKSIENMGDKKAREIRKTLTRSYEVG